MGATTMRISIAFCILALVGLLHALPTPDGAVTTEDIVPEADVLEWADVAQEDRTKNNNFDLVFHDEGDSKEGAKETNKGTKPQKQELEEEDEAEWGSAAES